VEIDRGANDGIQVGMAVVNQGGLIGKITYAYDDRSVVRLVTDVDYAIECKVQGTEPAPVADGTVLTGTTSTSTADTTPSGENVDDLSTTTTAAPTTTTSSTVPVTALDGTPITADPTQTTLIPETTTTTTTPSTTTTAVPLLVTRETGGCNGRGVGKLPAMQYVTDNPTLGKTADIGDIITTTGGSKSLAPPDIVIGEVINKIPRGGSAGPVLEIELGADLDHLNFVQVVLYRPPNEVPAG
jgi:rod shape-determining protein MreC